MDMCILHLSASAAICKNGSVTDWYQSHVIENKFETLTITTFLFPSKKVLCAAISSGIGKALERHEEQIEEILNHLGELSLDRIEHLEDKVEGLEKGRNASKKTSTSEAPAMTQVAIRKLVADSVTAALEAQAATMANTSNPNRNTVITETPSVKTETKKIHKLQPFVLSMETEGALGPYLCLNNEINILS
ncbi:hypothetical protein Tco_0448769 [Tanacetum coccineum]